MQRNRTVNISEVQKRLKDLHLSAMAEQLGVLSEDGRLADQSPMNILDILTIQETQVRLDRKTKRLIKKSELYYPGASVPGIIFSPDRRMNVTLLDSLLSCSYIAQGQSVWLLGSSGTGKTYISCVLGKQACLLQYSVRYYTTSEFFHLCAAADEQNNLAGLIAETCKKNLIILDDFLLTGINFEQTRYLYELLNRKPDPKVPRSFIISSQLMEEEMKLRLLDASPALAEAIMSRLKSKQLKLEISGKDMRLENSSSQS